MRGERSIDSRFNWPRRVSITLCGSRSRLRARVRSDSLARVRARTYNVITRRRLAPFSLGAIHRYLPFVNASSLSPLDTRRIAILSALIRQQRAREQYGDTRLPISALTVIASFAARGARRDGDRRRRRRRRRRTERRRWRWRRQRQRRWRWRRWTAFCASARKSAPASEAASGRAIRFAIRPPKIEIQVARLVISVNHRFILFP